MNKKTLLGIILLFACTEKEETTIIHSHPNLPEPDFKLNLESDSGENLDYVTINWQNSDGEMVLKDENGNIVSITENYYLYDNLQPGTFKDVFFQLSLEDTIYNDTMQIFTRTVIPITKFISIFDEVIEKNGYWDENEQFTDGNQIYDEGEEYEDGNDTYDFKDIDGDGKCDFTGSMEAGNFTSNECEPFTDSNNGQYDPWETYQDGNGQYDFGEEYEDGNVIYDFGEAFIDSENGQYDPWENFTDSNNGQYDPWETYQDGNGQYDFKDIDSDGKCDFTGSMEAGTFTSNECEPFTDSVADDYDSWMQFINEYSNIGGYDPWENFTDSNNGQYDPWETYQDGNGQYDVEEEYEDGNGVYDVGENFTDCNDSQTICNGDANWNSSLGNNSYDFGEEFIDSENGQYDPWEDFTDSNNGQFDLWEWYEDGNGQYDFGEDFTDSVDDDYGTWNDFINTYSNIGGYDPWENFTDSGNGQFDPWEWYEDGNGSWDENESYQDGNGIYDIGEEFTDSNNGQYDSWETYTDSNNGQYDSWETYVDGDGHYNIEENYTDSENGQHDPWETYVDGNGQYDFGEEYEDGNLQYDFGEEYTDSENGQYDPWENFTDSGNGLYEPWEDFIDEPSSRYYRKLNWEKTLEPQTSESAYVIYRVIQDSLDYLLTPEICDCTIDTISSFLTNFYDDNDSLVLITENPLGYYYRIKVLKDGFEKFSFINYADWPNPEKINLTQDNVSTNKENYVKMTWDPIQNQTYFYQYEIYQTIGHPSTANDTSLIAIIEDPNLNHFLAEKRIAGIGQTCYYSIATVDVSGKREYSDFIKGLTKP